jgi:hypothetical protein
MLGILGLAATAAYVAPDAPVGKQGARFRFGWWRRWWQAWTVNGSRFAADQAIAELQRLAQAGALKAVLLVRGDVTSQRLVSAVERIGRETPLTLTVAR